MAFNSLGQYTGNHKAYDHIGNQIPNIEVNDGQRPDIFKPAEWLPVQFYDKYFENWMVILAGHPVALDNNGDVVPAGLADTAATVVYTSTDVTEGTIDVTTGAAVTVAKTVTLSGVTTFLGGSEALAVSKPIGYAPYCSLKWAGGDGYNPALFNQHNYNMQHGVTVGTDKYLELPLVPAEVAAPEALSFTSVSGVHTSTALANLPVAKNTQRTEMEFSGANATAFVTEVTTAAAVVAEGQWHVDLTTGVVTVYRAAGAPTASLSYFHYAAVPASVSKFACAVGDLKPGDLVKCDANSNYVEFNPAVDNFADLLGQVLKRKDMANQSLLSHVRTEFSPALATDAAGAFPAYAGQRDQMPGSATGGVPDNIHYTGAANLVVRINFFGR